MGTIRDKISGGARRLPVVSDVVEVASSVRAVEERLERLERLVGELNHERVVDINRVGLDIQDEAGRIGERFDATDLRLDATVDEAVRRAEAANAELTRRVEHLEGLLAERSVADER